MTWLICQSEMTAGETALIPAAEVGGVKSAGPMIETTYNCPECGEEFKVWTANA